MFRDKIKPLFKFWLFKNWNILRNAKESSRMKCESWGRRIFEFSPNSINTMKKGEGRNICERTDSTKQWITASAQPADCCSTWQRLPYLGLREIRKCAWKTRCTLQWLSRRVKWIKVLYQKYKFYSINCQTLWMALFRKRQLSLKETIK